jgi:hypothetical protein
MIEHDVLCPCAIDRIQVLCMCDFIAKVRINERARMQASRDCHPSRRLMVTSPRRSRIRMESAGVHDLKLLDQMVKTINDLNLLVKIDYSAVTMFQ